MKRTSYHLLRMGLAITFLWIGILIFKNPEAWGGYLQPWAAGLLPIPLEQAMLGSAVLDILIGFFILIDRWVYIASFLAAFHLIVVLITSGITDVTARDIGLLAAALALLDETLPAYIANKAPFLK